jgi:hypothetical protein
MSQKPSYLGLLNAVAVAELGGEALFSAWAAATPSGDVRAVLETVALREAEHARSFAKRINELGYSVRPKDDPRQPERLATARSKKISDLAKFERLGFGTRPNGPDIFTRFFDDMTIDIQTGELLGRYLSEERDTGRRLVACYTALVEAERPTANGAKRSAKGKGKGEPKAKATKGPKGKKN